MSFKLDFSKAFNNGSVADGTYEAVFYMVNTDNNPHTGNEFIRFDLIIRNDVDQKYQNAHLFDQAYRSNDTHEFNMSRIAWMAAAAGLEKDKEYNDIQDLCNDFVGKPVKVTIKNQTRDYKGKTYHDTNIIRWDKTNYPQLNHQWKDAPKKNSSNTTAANPDNTNSGNTAFNGSDTTTVEQQDLPF